MPSRLPAVLAFASMVPAAVAVAWPARAAACPPAAIVDGDAELVASIAAALAERGLATPPPPGCPAVHARVERDAAELRVAVEDPHGRRSERVVADAGSAATLIESWTRTDVSAPLLPLRALATPVDSIDPEPAPLPAPHVVRAVAEPRRYGVGLSWVASLANDGTRWVGLDLAGCVRVGRTCAGGLARATFEDGAWDEGGIRRGNLDLLFTLDVPFRWGPVVLKAGGGIGVGWTHTRGTTLSGGDAEVDGGGLRTNLHAGAGFPVGRGFSVVVDVSFDRSLASDSLVYELPGAMFPAEPDLWVRWSFGVRWGAP